MLENFKRAIFRALCLCCVLIGGGGLMAEPNPEELVDLGLKSMRLGNVSGKVEDFIRGRKYIEKACDLKYGGGCGNLGVLYQNGQGVEKDLTKAAYLYSKACELKESFGCGALAVLYINGQGVEKNLTKADQYISKACKLGDQEACGALKEK
ncbi:sel1 repeat family protein [Helicobacter pylori]|nr:sel1 repeat family protein [Helicobacter pylori]